MLLTKFQPWVYPGVYPSHTLLPFLLPSEVEGALVVFLMLVVTIIVIITIFTVKGLNPGVFIRKLSMIVQVNVVRRTWDCCCRQ